MTNENERDGAEDYRPSHDMTTPSYIKPPEHPAPTYSDESGGGPPDPPEDPLDYFLPKEGR